ncbi:BA75_04918T0 [Komagataella pastoris]|uniref:BA75_04918T0 n=1 Tax=Komagataella pastoris TaxID=4922 RepID=A0A1B2JIB6_PICPA|nr:BA75_04918T0 [Komagataella pastoris]
MNFFRRRRGNSVDSDELDIAGPKKGSQRTKSRKPPNTAFRQQRLKAWQPIYSPKTILPLLFVVFLIMCPIGIALIFRTYRVQNLVINYSKCDELEDSNDYTEIPKNRVNFHFDKSTSSYSNYQNPRWRTSTSTDSLGNSVRTCHIEFDIPNDIHSPLYFYFKLTNFFQNHRRYVESYDLEQLKGEAVPYDDIDSDCKPFAHSGDKIVYPCGLVANSYFNDTLASPVLLNPAGGSENVTYELTTKDIAWKTDRKTYKMTTYNWDEIVPPPNWEKRYPEGYTEDNIFNITEDEFFQNWMRTAALPSFMKLAAKNTTSPMESGTYQIDIGLNYPVSIFGGTKSLVITSNNILGGRHFGLGVCYLIVAGASFLFGFLFLLKVLIKPRKIGDHSLLNFEDERASQELFTSERRDYL